MGIQFSTRILFSIIFVFFTKSVFATTTIEKTKVNGFEVELINTPGTKQFLISFDVPVGSRMDPPKFAGRAHFMEHMALKGSTRFPGYETLKNEVSKIGGSSNAMTGMDYTHFYILLSTPEHAERATELQLASLGGLELKPEVIAKELEAVDNEVNTEGAKNVSKTILRAPSRELLPEGHFLQRYDLGTTDILKSFTVDDFKSIYYGNYTPEFVKVVVAGDFSQESLKKEKVMEWLNKYLQPADISKDPQGFKLEETPIAKQDLPSKFSKGQKPYPMLFMSDEAGNRNLTISIELKNKLKGKDYLAFDVLSDYLGLKGPGTLLHYLDKEKGWVESISISLMNSNNLMDLLIFMSLSMEGEDKIDEVITEVYRALAQVQKDGIPEATLEAIKASKSYFLEDAYELPSDLHLLHRRLSGIEDHNMDKLSFIDAYKSVDQASIKSAVDLIVPERGLYFYLGPNIEGEFDSLWERNKKLESLNSIMPEWKLAVSGNESGYSIDFDVAEVEDIDLSQSSEDKSNLKNQALKKISDTKIDAIEMWVEKDYSSDSGAFTLGAGYKFDDIKDKILFQFFVTAFKEKFQREILLFSAKGIKIDVSYGSGSLEWSVKGPVSQSLKAFKFLTEKWSSFAPDVSYLKLLKKRYRANLIQKRSTGFVGSEALLFAKDLATGKHNALELLDVIESLDISTVYAWKKSGKMTYRPIFMAKGSFSNTELREVKSSIWNAYRPLMPYTNRDVPIKEVDTFLSDFVEIPLGKGRDKESSGIARVYQGPTLSNTKEFAATIVLGAVLGRLVFDLNRSEKGLGYVHGASSYFVDENRSRQIVFYGQATNEQNNEETIKGWEIIISSFLKKEIPENVILGVAQGVAAQFANTVSKHDQYVDKWLTDRVIYGDINKRAEIVAEIRSLTAKDVFDVAAKYLGKDAPFKQLVIKHGAKSQSCLNELTE